MSEVRVELGRAVRDVLAWMDLPAETAGPMLGLNAGTLTGMLRGIAPMRSLVIRFATGIARQCERQTGAQAWWSNVDTWLELAGYQPRREGAPPPPTSVALPPAPPGRSPTRPRPAPSPPPEPPMPADPAGNYFRPQYERKTWGSSFVHIFWILDPQGRKVFSMNLAADQDYRARAQDVKRDLARLTRDQFERKYARHRFTGE